MSHLQSLQSAIEKAGLGALLLMDDKNIFYATGFMPSDSAALVTPDRAWLVTDSRYIEDAEKKCVQGVEVVLTTASSPLGAALSRLASGLSGAVGAEENKLSHGMYVQMERLLGRELAAELTYRMMRHGAFKNSFDPIAITGAHTSMPHGVPGDSLVCAGDFVTMDFGCIRDGYCSDMTRTVAVGFATDEMKNVYDTVLCAQLAGIAVRDRHRGTLRRGQGHSGRGLRRVFRPRFRTRRWPGYTREPQRQPAQ